MSGLYPMPLIRAEMPQIKRKSFLGITTPKIIYRRSMRRIDGIRGILIFFNKIRNINAQTPNRGKSGCGSRREPQPLPQESTGREGEARAGWRAWEGGGQQGRWPNISHRRPWMAAGHVARGRAWLECKARIRAGQEQAHGCAVPWWRKTVMSGAVVARLMSYA